MTLFIQLTIAGEDVGPFNLYSDVDGFVTPFEENISRETLVAGAFYNSAPDDTTQVKIQSTGDCTNSIIVDIAIPATTTTTTSSSTTTTTTTTGIPLELTYTIYEADCETACPRTNGEILINGVQAYLWLWTNVPASGVLYPSAGDTIVINADCYAGGTCGVGMQATISIVKNSVECDSAIDDMATCTFTFTENTSIEITPGCLTP